MKHKSLSKIIVLASLWLILSSCAFLESYLPVTSNVENVTTTSSTVATATTKLDYTWTDESPAPDEFSVTVIGSGNAKLTDILQAEAQKAIALGRHPYIEFYADWCPPCNAIKKNLGDPLMVEAFAGTYIIKLDTDVWGDKLSGLGLYVPGIPAFYELDENGKPTGRMITGAAWGEDIPANIAPPMKAFFEGE
jgi:thiol-disulfide isomerase/thioredoxin